MLARFVTGAGCTESAAAWYPNMFVPSVMHMAGGSLCKAEA